MRVERNRRKDWSKKEWIGIIREWIQEHVEEIVKNTKHWTEKIRGAESIREGYRRGLEET